MEFETGFESLWNRYHDFEFPEEGPTSCVFALKFSDWTSELCAKATSNPSIVSINQAKVLLIDKYFEWRSTVPKTHRNRVAKLGHRCVFQVFEQAYEALKAVELSLTPPMLFVPPLPAPPPPPTPPPQIAGIFIGELDKP